MTDALKTVSKEVEPRPGAGELERIDRASERISPDDEALADWFTRYRDQHRSRLAVDIALLRQAVPAPARVLECGAVPLLLTFALDDLGYEVSAVDLAPERFSRSIEAAGLAVQPCDIERQPLPFAAETFDVLLFNELFEHLRINPVFTLREVLRVLRPDGLLFLSTPNLRSFRGLRNLVLSDRGHASSGGVFEQYEKLDTLGHMGHVREYTVTEVAEFLTRIGFQARRVVYRGGHGSGLVGLAERIAPSMRPFFTLVASPGAARGAAKGGIP
jgi:SAM-dependent methyltransferase